MPHSLLPGLAEPGGTTVLGLECIKAPGGCREGPGVNLHKDP